MPRATPLDAQRLAFNPGLALQTLLGKPIAFIPATRLTTDDEKRMAPPRVTKSTVNASRYPTPPGEDFHSLGAAAPQTIHGSHHPSARPARAQLDTPPRSITPVISPEPKAPTPHAEAKALGHSSIKVEDIKDPQLELRSKKAGNHASAEISRSSFANSIVNEHVCMTMRRL